MAAKWQGKYWVFTINNPKDSTLPRQWGEKVQYCVWQVEKTEEGPQHLQGYVVFKTNQRLAALKKLDGTAHWEPRMGSHEEAKQYCMKEETRQDGPFEIGDEYGVFAQTGVTPDDLAYCLHYVACWRPSTSPPPSPVHWDAPIPDATRATHSSDLPTSPQFTKKRKIED